MKVVYCVTHDFDTRSLLDVLYLNTYHEHNAVGNFSVRVLCVGFSGFGCCNFVAFYHNVVTSSFCGIILHS